MFTISMRDYLIATAETLRSIYMYDINVVLSDYYD